MKRVIFTLLVIVSPLVASMEAAGGPQQDQVLVEGLGLTVHHVNTVNIIYQNSSPEPESPHSHSTYPLRFAGCLLALFLAHVQWGRYWSQVWEDRTGRMSAGCPSRPQFFVGRNYTVSSGSALTDSDSALSPADVARTLDSYSQASNERGRRSATVTASNNGSSHPNELSSRATAQLFAEPENEFSNTNNVTTPKAPDPPPTQTSTAPAQAPCPAQFRLPDDLTTTSSNILYSLTDSVSKRTRSIPVPGHSVADTNWTRPRHQSLPHKADYKRTPSRPVNAAGEVYQHPIAGGGREQEVEAPRSSVPLRRTLYYGSSDLVSVVDQWLVLFIAVNIEVEDPERDLSLFQQLLGQPNTNCPNIHFESLSGTNATRSKIKAKLTLLYLRAGSISDYSRLLVFLTGSGDEANGMRLMNEEVITEEDLREWLSYAHTRSNLSNVQPVPIIFDICRVDKDKPSAKIHHMVNLIWSCSPGQRAQALGFQSQNIPNSCFLIALFLTSHDLLDSGPANFEDAFRRRMKQLGNLIEYSYRFWHRKPGECDRCATETGGVCPPPGSPQEPQGEQAGWDAVAGLGALIVKKYPEYVRNIVEVLANEMQACGILGTDEGPTLERPSLQPETFVQQGSSPEQRHSRGATRTTLQTLAPGTCRTQPLLTG